MLTEAELAQARALSAESMTGRVVLERGGSDGGWDPVNGPTPGTPPETVYDGPFRAQAIRDNATVADAAGQHVTVRAYKITIPHHVGEPAVGDRAIVRAYPRDPGLVGKVLTVTGVVYGGLGIERVLYCDLDLTNQSGGA